MKIDISLLLLATSALTSALPQPLSDVNSHEVASLSDRESFSSVYDEITHLFKRKGGGGGGGKGGGGSSSGGSSSGEGGSSSGGSTSGGSSSSGSSGSRPAGSSTSSSGGKSSGGTGVTPSYGGGRYYAGGASVPYSAGSRTPSGLLPATVLGVAALSVFPGLWLYGAYSYPYTHPYTFHNASTNQNETKPVNCLCEEYQVCGCDDNTNSTYIDSLIGNGSYGAQDSTVNVADNNGTSTIFINGTLANGTTAASAGASFHQGMMQTSGYWVMAAVVGATVMFT